jgi:hypothetical protein
LESSERFGEGGRNVGEMIRKGNFGPVKRLIHGDHLAPDCGDRKRLSSGRSAGQGGGSSSDIVVQNFLNVTSSVFLREQFAFLNHLIPNF